MLIESIILHKITACTFYSSYHPIYHPIVIPHPPCTGCAQPSITESVKMVSECSVATVVLMYGLSLIKKMTKVTNQT